MINYDRILDNKPKVKDANNNNIIDLLTQRYKYRPGSIENFIVVDDRLEARPDLIAKVIYNDTDQTEIVLKQNDISNPFSIKNGDILVFRNISDFNFLIENSKTDDVEKIRNQYIDKNKKTSVDKNLLEFNKSKGGIGLPPNIASPNDTEVVVTSDNKILLGSNVTEKCKQTDGVLSLSDFYNKVIKNKLKNNLLNGGK